MKRVIYLGLLLCWFSYSSAAVTNGEWAEAYAMARFINGHAERCIEEKTKFDKKTHKQWVKRNKLDDFYDHINVIRMNDPALAKLLKEAEVMSDDYVDKQPMSNCSGLADFLSLDSYNPVSKNENIESELINSKSSVKSSQTPSSQKTKTNGEDKPQPVPSSVTSNSKFDAKFSKKLEGAIETLIFHYASRGGEYATVPYFLFKDGTATSDVSLVVDYNSVKEHQNKYPKRWFKWRKRSGKYQVKEGSKWVDFAYQDTYASYKSSYRLNRRYKRMSGGFGGGSYKLYEFSKSGRFTSGGVVFANSETASGGASVSLVHKNADKQGRYSIDGYVLTLEFDNGDVRHYPFVSDGKGNPDVIWLDGYGYVEY